MNGCYMNFGRLVGAISRRLRSIPHYLNWLFPYGLSKKNKNGLLQFKDIHLGKRCFIIANGPSLKNMDLTLLQNEITIGMNRIYLMEKVNGVRPNYIVSIDIPCQLEQFKEEYDSLLITKFFNWEARKLFTSKENLFFIYSRYSRKFGKDIVKERIGNSLSVTYACLHIAYYMGFEKVYLIGKDHSYDTGGVVNKRMIQSSGNETNHFIDGYYTKGMKWGMPNYSVEEKTYELAKKAFELDGRKIFDATIDGKLQIFEKVDYYSLFESEDNDKSNNESY